MMPLWSQNTDAAMIFFAEMVVLNFLFEGDVV